MARFNVNNRTQGGAVRQNTDIERAESSWREAELAVKSAMQELGRAYFEANKDHAEAEYYEQVTHIQKCMENEILWHQYRLSLEGKLQCEKCGAVITSNSLFCNQCGNPVRAWDFSSLCIEVSINENTANQSVCRKCGKPLVAGAAFCEACGAEV